MNTSTNVLKRWNNTNGMLNWFLHKIGRSSTPDANEVVQLARVHVARSVIKKHRTSLITVTQLTGMPPNDAAAASGGLPAPPAPPGAPAEGGGGTSESSVLGKRKADGRPIGGLAHVEGANKKQLFENLKAMYPGVKKQSVFDAVDDETWIYHDEGSYAPNIMRLAYWSEANGLWQHFAKYCRSENIKHDMGLFGGDPEQQQQKEQNLVAKAASIGGPKKVANAVGPPVLLPGQWAHKPSGGGGGKVAAGGGGGAASGAAAAAKSSADGAGQKKAGGGGGGFVGEAVATANRSSARTPYHVYFDKVTGEFQENLRKRVEAFGTDKMPIRFVQHKMYQWDASVMEDWMRRSVQFADPDVTVLMPYVVVMRKDDNGERENQGSTLRTLFGKDGAPPADVRQFCVYTFKYGTGYFLHISVSLVLSSRDTLKARFTAKYIISSPSDNMLPCDCGPVTLDPNGASDVPHEDDYEEQGLHFLTGGVAASQDTSYTELWEKAKARNSVATLPEVMYATAGAALNAAPTTSTTIV